MATRQLTPLDQALRSKGMTGSELARHLEVGEAQVSRWRNGLRPPQEIQGRIAQKLHVKKAELWP